MGRDSGFVALHASLANCDTNVCLIPEVRCLVANRNGSCGLGCEMATYTAGHLTLMLTLRLCVATGDYACSNLTPFLPPPSPPTAYEQVDFTFDQILNYVTHRFTNGNRDHCVIVVAEGAGQQNVAYVLMITDGPMR